MGPSRFELESEDPQSPRMPGYPMAPFHTIFSAVPYVLTHIILHFSHLKQNYHREGRPVRIRHQGSVI